LQTQLKQRQSGWLLRVRDWIKGLTAANRSGLAVASAVVLGLSVWIAQPSLNRGLDWDEIALAHVIGEPSAMASKGTLSQVALLKALAPYGLALKGELGITRFMEHCAVPGGRGTHIVIETRDLGKVTLFLPPSGMRVAGGEARGEGFSAQIVDIVGVSFGIVTDRPENLPALAALLNRQMIRNG